MKITTENYVKTIIFTSFQLIIH